MAYRQNGPGGCAPDTCSTALLLLDVINTFDFPQGEALLKAALPLVPRLLNLKARCYALGIPVIYVNDHFGRWRSDFSAVVEGCQNSQAIGGEFVRPLVPGPEDYFVFKPMHSGFYQTALDLLLAHLGAGNLIITGLASNICVLATAQDAHMRGYRLWLPPDGMAACSLDDHDYAQRHFEQVLKADRSAVGTLNLEALSQRL